MSESSKHSKSVTWVWVTAAAVFIAAVFFGYQWYKARDVRLSERPEQSADTLAMEPNDSSIVASLVVSHQTLRTVLNDLGKTLSGSRDGSEDLKCVKSSFPPIDACLTANWSATYQAGAIQVGKAGELLKVSVPVSFSGSAGFGGDIAGALSLNKKSIDGAAVVSVSLGAKLDERFCPVLTANDPEFAWTKEARIEAVGRTRVFNLFDIGPLYLDVGRHFNGPIREALRKAAQEAAHAIPCDPVRAEIAKLWQRYSVPVALQGQPTVYINAIPEKVGSSGLLSEDTGVRIVLMVSGKAALETSAGPTTSLGDLPAHVHLDPQPGRLSLSVPVRVEYTKMVEAIKSALATREFASETSAGKMTVRLKDIEIFPSGKRLAVGVQFSADAPTSIFDTTGTAWLVARPVIGADGKSIGLTDVAVHRKVDNAAIQFLTAVFDEQINGAIAGAAKYDLRKDEQGAVEALQRAIADPTKTGGVKLTVTEPSVQFGRIAVEEGALSAEGLFKAGWSAEVQEVKL